MNLMAGGLRGGDAVHAFLPNFSLSDLHWRMRHLHLSSLVSYIHEVAATQLFRSLPMSCNVNQRVLASVYGLVINKPHIAAKLVIYCAGTSALAPFLRCTSLGLARLPTRVAVVHNRLPAS